MLPVRQPHKHNNRFYNEEGEKAHKNVVVMAARMMWHVATTQKPKHGGASHDPMSIYTPQTPVMWSHDPVITWIGHATFLIQIGGINILTDPIFGSPALFLKRHTPPGIAPAALPPIDVVLISHNHWDHMHGPSLRQLLPELKKNNGHVFVPHGDDAWFHKRLFEQAKAFHWGERKTLEIPLTGRLNQSAPSNITFTFLPARHWSRRGLFDRNKSLWGSWMIECNGQTIYFAGDTAYADHFKEIQSHFPTIDTALMPIAPCEPDNIMREMHMNAEEAVHAYLDLNAQTFIPMHWHTFNLGADHIMTPLHRLQKKWELLQLPTEQLVVPNIGCGVDLGSD